MAGIAIIAVTMAAAEAIWMKDFMTTKPFSYAGGWFRLPATFEVFPGKKAALMRPRTLHNRIFMGLILPFNIKTLPQFFPKYGKYRA